MSEWQHQRQQQTAVAAIDSSVVEKRPLTLILWLAIETIIFHSTDEMLALANTTLVLVKKTFKFRWWFFISKKKKWNFSPDSRQTRKQECFEIWYVFLLANPYIRVQIDLKCALFHILAVVCLHSFWHKFIVVWNPPAISKHIFISKFCFQADISEFKLWRDTRFSTREYLPKLSIQASAKACFPITLHTFSSSSSYCDFIFREMVFVFIHIHVLNFIFFF